ncbi:MAG: hypothetical protein LBB24_01095, partial [Rickettsiales bacterium]|nr:hypothetical protein [Rickettsiales bacterium]
MVLEITGEPILYDNPKGHTMYSVECEEGGLKKYIYYGELEWGVDGKPIINGKGELLSEERRKIYEGNFKHGTFDGEGIEYCSDGSIYEGNFRNDKKHGQGTYKYSDGNMYKGNWENGKQHGQGTLHYSSGNVYEGNWESGKQHGHGTLHYSSGNVYEGNWENHKRHGQSVYTSKEGCVYERLYSEDSLKEDTPMSREFYRENGEVGDGDSGERRKLYTVKYDENGCSTVTYNHYGPDGILERKLKVDYRKLNELLNEGRLSSIVPGAIEDVTENLEENERIRTLVEAQEHLEACARQYLQDKMHSGERGLDEGGTRELENLMLLADLRDPKIRVVRFSDQPPNEEKMKQRYDNVGALLESLGINPDTIENTTEDFIVTVISTTNGKHAVSAIIDLKRLRELKRESEDIATTDEQVIFIFDSSRAVGDPEYKEYNLGNIQEKNCMVVNGSIQNLGSCWYHSASSTIAVAENP